MFTNLERCHLKHSLHIHARTLFVVLLLSASALCKAAAPYEGDSLAVARPSMFQTLMSDIAISGEDGLAWLLAPLSYEGKDWLFVGSVAGTTVAAYAADGEVREFMRRNQQPGWYDAASYANEGGRVLWAEALTGALYLPGLLLDEPELRVTGRMVGQSLVYSGALTMTLRILFGRDRPYSEKGPRSFQGMQFGNAEQSLPSGHTTVAFALASVLSRRIGHPAATVLLYMAAAATGFARMYHDQHWASDVVLGAAIGHSAGWFVASREEQRSTGQSHAASGWTVAPAPAGLILQYRF